MVVCKYYRQGNCRYGQYCQFEHINTFGANNKVDSYNENEFAATVVANEVLIAERGGQWLLSCFGPFTERPSIPGMDDLSPEEVRWEMYQAQKNGMVEQAKLHFQQLCQDMKAKRDALKNPSHETIAMLKKIMGTGQEGRINTGANTAGKSGFSFASPQLGLPSNTSASNVFGNKTFATQSNPFSGGFTASSTASIFGRPSTTTNPVFGGTPAFGTSLGGFSNTTNTSSVFGGATNTSTFNTGQNTQAFGSVTSQTNSIFGGGASQPVFGQPSVFGASTQVNNVFARPQTSQSTTSAFNNGPAASTSLFNSPMTSQAANPFSGASTLQTTNPVFGTTASSGSFTSGIFSQSKTLPAFGGAPIFGGGSNFANNPAPMFGEQTSFASSTMSNNIFGATSNTTPSFSSAGQPTNTFGATAAAPNIFGNVQSTAPVMAPPNAAPFGTAAPTTTSPFVTATSQFEGTNTTATPFSRPTFGVSTGNTNETFGTTVTTSAAPFGTANTGATFGSANTTTSQFTTSTFGDLKNSPFASTNTTVTTTTTNPFAPRTQQINSPFGNVVQNQASNTVTVSSSGPFGKSPFGSTVTTAIIDDTVYSIEGQLTDDEKSMYLAEKFCFGKIPLKPPTKDIR